MEALIRLCGCTSKSLLDAYDILLLLLFLCYGSDYYDVYTINEEFVDFFANQRERERERDVIPFFTKGCYSCFETEIDR